MLSVLHGLFVIALAAAVPAWGAETEPNQAGCLSPGDTLEAVSTKQVIAPAQAIILARNAAHEGEIVRALLCREDGSLVYLVMALKRDGRLVRVTVDGKAGKIKLVH